MTKPHSKEMVKTVDHIASSHLPDVLSRVKGFMEDNFLFAFGDDVAENEDLFKSGIIDSFGYLRLIEFLKNECGVTLEDDDMLSNVMVSFKQVAAFVSQKLAQQA